MQPFTKLHNSPRKAWSVYSLCRNENRHGNKPNKGLSWRSSTETLAELGLKLSSCWLLCPKHKDHIAFKQLLKHTEKSSLKFCFWMKGEECRVWNLLVVSGVLHTERLYCANDGGAPLIASFFMGVTMGGPGLRTCASECIWLSPGKQ